MTSAHCLSWVLRRGAASVTCAVDINRDRSFDVRIIPSARPAQATVEHYLSAVAALERHAEVTRGLREEGWRVAAR